LLLALERFGNMSFNEVAAPAIAFARDGFPIHRGLLGQERFGIRDLAEKFRNFWPASAALIFV
jgi:gamma-glutamyltranspeptidase / glutathione hydrolase